MENYRNISMNGGSDQQANVLRTQILNSSNKIFNAKTVYYISPNGKRNTEGTQNNPWSFDFFLEKSAELFSDTAVLFERNGVYRTTSTIKTISGVSYGAYGDGKKPSIYGSTRNYAEVKLWLTTENENIWMLEDCDELITREAGSIVFDEGKLVGCQKLSFDKLSIDGDFYEDRELGKLYLYMSNGNPGSLYEDIEISNGITLFAISQVENVNIDNLCLKFCGNHAIGGSTAKNVKISNCEMGWIGGAHVIPEERFGNGVEFYGSAWDSSVENCWLYQIYDAGLTFQKSRGLGTFENITFKHNLIEYSSYSIEHFNHISGGETGIYKNIDISDNILRFAGYGWGSGYEQRQWWVAVAHFVGWSRAYSKAENFAIKNNIFDVSISNFVYWHWEKGLVQPNLFVEGNCFYQKSTPDFAKHYRALTCDACFNFGDMETAIKATNQAELEKAVECFDVNPQTVKWLDN